VELAVGAAATQRVVMDRPPVFLDGARVLAVERFVDELDDRAHVSLAADVSREDDEVDFVKQVGRDALLDDSVDERLDVGGVGRPQYPVASVQRLRERLEGGWRVYLRDDLHVGVEVVTLRHQVRHRHPAVVALVVAGGERDARFVWNPDLPGPFVDADWAVPIRDERHVRVEQCGLAGTSRSGKEDDAVGLIQQPQQRDQFRRKGVALDQVDWRHRVRGLLADGDVRAVLADSRERNGTPDGFLGVV